MSNTTESVKGFDEYPYEWMGDDLLAVVDSVTDWSTNTKINESLEAEKTLPQPPSAPAPNKKRKIVIQDSISEAKLKDVQKIRHLSCIPIFVCKFCKATLRSEKLFVENNQIASINLCTNCFSLNRQLANAMCV